MPSKQPKTILNNSLILCGQDIKKTSGSCSVGIGGELPHATPSTVTQLEEPHPSSDRVCLVADVSPNSPHFHLLQIHYPCSDGWGVYTLADRSFLPPAMDMLFEFITAVTLGPPKFCNATPNRHRMGTTIIFHRSVGRQQIESNTSLQKCST